MQHFDVEVESLPNHESILRTVTLQPGAVRRDLGKVGETERGGQCVLRYAVQGSYHTAC